MNLQIFGVSGYEHGLNPAADKVYTSRHNAIRFHSQRCAPPCWFDCKWTSCTENTTQRDGFQM
jgi:hypothetical protein